MRTILLTSLALTSLALAACSPPPAADKAGDAAPAASTSPMAAVAMTIRPGRWKTVTTGAGGPTTDYDCITTDDINEMMQETGEDETCTSAAGFQATAEGLVYEATCSGETTGTIRSVVTGDLQNAYVSSSTVSLSGPDGPMTFQMSTSGTYEGACRGDE